MPLRWSNHTEFQLHHHDDNNDKPPNHHQFHDVNHFDEQHDNHGASDDNHNCRTMSRNLCLDMGRPQSSRRMAPAVSQLPEYLWLCRTDRYRKLNVRGTHETLRARRESVHGFHMPDDDHDQSPDNNHNNRYHNDNDHARSLSRHLLLAVQPKR
jgi:hypothetical protein